MKNILASLLCLLWSVNAWAAQPTFDARSISTCTGCSVNSFSHSIGFGCTNDIVIVDNLFSNDASISSVTVGGNATTPIATDTNFQSGGWSIDMQRKVGASTGANTVTSTYSASANSSTVSVRSYCGVDQTTPLGAAATDDHAPDGTDPSINVASAIGDLVIDFAAGGDPDVAAWTVGGGGQTQRTNNTAFAGAQTFLDSDKAGAASSTNLSWTYGGVNNNNVYWASIGVALKPVSTAIKPNIQVIVVE